MILLSVVNIDPILAFGGGFDSNNIANVAPEGNTENLKAPIRRVSNTILLLIQIASIAGVIIMGIKYMYASAEQKASLKKSMLPFVIGIVFVFGASTVAQFVMTAFTEVTQ